MKKKLLLSLLGVAVAGAGWFGYAAYRAQQNLVTLNVRNMDVREVVKKMERQTWESIFVHKDVEGKVTLNVRKVPLEQVLSIIDEQLSTRWSMLYPLYSSGKSLAALEKALRGEVDPSTSGWTNLQSRGGFGGGFGGGGPGRGGFGGGAGMFGDTVRSQNQLVSLQIQSKEVQFATLALGRFTQARVVPEDGTAGVVTMKLNQTPISEAVAQLAKEVRRKWTKLYALRGERRGGPGEFAGRGDDRRRGWQDMTPEEREEMRKQREALEAELLATLSAEERERLAQLEQQRQAMMNMSDEERRAQFANMAQQRQLDRLKNTTPQQRVERYRRMGQRGQGGQRRPQ